MDTITISKNDNFDFVIIGPASKTKDSVLIASENPPNILLNISRNLYYDKPFYPDDQLNNTRMDAGVAKLNNHEIIGHQVGNKLRHIFYSWSLPISEANMDNLINGETRNFRILLCVSSYKMLNNRDFEKIVDDFFGNSRSIIEIYNSKIDKDQKKLDARWLLSGILNILE